MHTSAIVTSPPGSSDIGSGRQASFKHVAFGVPARPTSWCDGHVQAFAEMPSQEKPQSLGAKVEVTGEVIMWMGSCSGSTGTIHPK